jgi:hypothetical protein
MVVEVLSDPGQIGDNLDALCGEFVGGADAGEHE